MNGKLAIAIRIVNFVKTSFVKLRLFITLCKDMDADHDTLLFHIALQWLSKDHMLVQIYKLRKEVKLSLKDQENYLQQIGFN